ncbi:hypothetical protein [Paenibacillus taichungensis]|uniref:hypothetical protein n=1 Tax=Paenibacillus taichungensis TaxID=484184 RepID=UPI0035D644D2
MENEKYNDYELSKFKITFSSSKLNAEQVGTVISQTAIMYKVIQDYLDSPVDLRLVNVTQGSFVFDFLGDPVVLDKLNSMCQALYKSLGWYTHYIGSNLTWDISKYFIMKFSKRTGLGRSEAERFIKAFSEQQNPSMQTYSKVEYDFKNQKATFFYDQTPIEEVEKWRQNDEEMIDDIARKYLNHQDIELPPRKTKHQ